MEIMIKAKESKIIPEGKQVLKIIKVNEEKLKDFGKIEVILEDEKNRKHKEIYNVRRKDQSVNDGAMWHLTNLIRAALGLEDHEEKPVQLQELVGKYIRCEVTHEKVERKNEPGTYAKYSRLGKEKEYAEGFDNPIKTVEDNKKPENIAINLNSILGE